MNKRKSTPAGLLEQKCEKAWSAKILARDPVCRSCKVRKSVHPHHLVKRSQSLAVKFDLDNGIGLCVLCHNRAESSPADGVLVAYETVGFRAFEALVDRSREIIYSAPPSWFAERLEALK